MAWWSRGGSGEAEGKSKWLPSYDGVTRDPPPNSKEIWGKWGGGHGTLKYQKINLQTDKLKGEIIHIAVNPKDIWRNTCSCVCLELFKIITNECYRAERARRLRLALAPTAVAIHWAPYTQRGASASWPNGYWATLCSLRENNQIWAKETRGQTVLIWVLCAPARTSTRSTLFLNSTSQRVF